MAPLATVAGHPTRSAEAAPGNPTSVAVHLGRTVRVNRNVNKQELNDPDSWRIRCPIRGPNPIITARVVFS